ncbi:MAG TPA: WbqC family protein [Thermoanaerobaculia bacterium]|nr:WbqC family protein [Thermoanaerobaculia bacterium]
MSKRIAILQSNYIPWKGYFDLIHDVDDFVFLDDVQYTRQDWRNRNRIKTDRGATWLTIPVGTDLKRRICDVELPASWAATHWNQLTTWYADAPWFEHYRPVFEPVYRTTWRTLSELNQQLIRTIATDLLGIDVRFHDSRDFDGTTRQQERVIDLVQRLGGDTYVSGPAAKAYIEPRRFVEAGIELVWKDYRGYPEYPQFHPPFVHEVTVLDLLFHTGPRAPQYIWAKSEGARSEEPRPFRSR